MTSPRHEAAYIGRQLQLARRRLSAIHFAATRDGDDPRLRAEADMLTCQIGALEAELKALQGEAA